MSSTIWWISLWYWENTIFSNEVFLIIGQTTSNRFLNVLGSLTQSTSIDNIVFVGWSSDSGIWYSNEWVSSVNPASYTDNGVAHTVLAVWEGQIGDTLTVYARYQDDCGIEYLDSIKVVIEDEI